MNAKLKNVNKEEEVIEKTVTETEGAESEEDKDNKPQPPAVTEEPKKDGFFKKVGKGFKKVGSGVKTVLDKDVKLWQILAAPVIIAGVVAGAKAIYDKGQKDAMGLPDEDDFQLPEEEDIKALETTADTEEVIDVEDYEDEPDVDEVTENEDEEVYEDEEEFIEE